MKNTLILLPFLSLACSEYELSQMCTDDEPAFDIEDVSTLEDASGSQFGWFVADGVMLDVPDYGSLTDGSQWRVVSVDVLLAVPASQYEGTANQPTAWDSAELQVDIIDGSDPNDTTAKKWSNQQQVSPGILDWETHRFDDMSGLASELDYYTAWWRFGFAADTSGEFIEGDQYFVGLVWPDYDHPEVGYSYFNRPCAANWQVNDGDDYWTQNSTTSSDADSCSWPMLRVNTEVSWESEDGC